MNLAPIILFVYNRPWHTQQAIEALLRNELASESEIFIFADGPKSKASDECKSKVSEVRRYIHTITGFKKITIREAPENKGLAESIIYGVTQVIKQFGKVIVVEDDIVTHRFFLRFMNEALDFYMSDKRIYTIGGFNYNFKIPKSYKKDVYIVHRAESWGWATWKDRWENVDWDISDASNFFSSNCCQRKFNRGGSDMNDMLRALLNGKIDSWAIRWDYHLYKNNAFCLRPVKTLVNNIGLDGTGNHCGFIDSSAYTAQRFDNALYNIDLVKKIKPNIIICRSFKLFFDGTHYVSPMIKIKKDVNKFLHLKLFR